MTPKKPLDQTQIQLDDLRGRIEELEKPRLTTRTSLEEMLRDASDSHCLEDQIKKNMPRNKNSPWVMVSLLALSIGLFLTGLGLREQRKSLDAITAAIANKNAQPETTTDSGLTTQFTLPLGDGKSHSLALHITSPCWIRVTKQTPVATIMYWNILLTEGQEPSGWDRLYTFDEQTEVEVRSGCPGQVHYEVNGVGVSPPNKSGKPQESEVVDLLL